VTLNPPLVAKKTNDERTVKMPSTVEKNGGRWDLTMGSKVHTAVKIGTMYSSEILVTIYRTTPGFATQKTV
jgi:hypothetical protein